MWYVLDACPLSRAESPRDRCIVSDSRYSYHGSLCQSRHVFTQQSNNASLLSALDNWPFLPTHHATGRGKTGVSLYATTPANNKDSINVDIQPSNGGDALATFQTLARPTAMTTAKRDEGFYSHPRLFNLRATGL